VLFRSGFTASHEYAKVESPASVAVGITSFAQVALGDVVFVSLPKVGAAVTKGAAFAAVESVKAASDVYSPVSGTVTAVNSGLADTPGLVNEDAEGKAWFVRVQPSALAADMAALHDAAAYKAHGDAEKH
jgi:glycine cleavage system H protein